MKYGTGDENWSGKQEFQLQVGGENRKGESSGMQDFNCCSNSVSF